MFGNILRSVSLPRYNQSYHEHLAALELVPLELRRLKSDLVLYYQCLHDLVALPIAVSILECYISPHKRKQVVIDCSVLHALLNFMKTTNNFFNRYVSCWNFSPHVVVDASSISCFKRLLSNIDLSTFT